MQIYSALFVVFFSLVLGTAIFTFAKKNTAVDRFAFFALSIPIIIFTALRPEGLSRDDLGYTLILQNLCPSLECKLFIQGSRDWLWLSFMGILKSFLSDWRSITTLSAIGCTLKLFVIYKACTQRVIALALFLPLIYVQYDMTQMRAGFAMSWFFLGLYFLVSKHNLAGYGFLSSSFLIHIQSLPSLLVAPLSFANKKYLITPIVSAILIAMIYVGFTPSLHVMSQLNIFRVGVESYLEASAIGAYNNVRVFPLAYLLLFFYSSLLLWNLDLSKSSLAKYVAGSVLLATLLAWLLTFNPTMQTRMFDFFIAPIVLLAGNIGNNKVKMIATALVAIALYGRLELISNWIIG